MESKSGTEGQPNVIRINDVKAVKPGDMVYIKGFSGPFEAIRLETDDDDKGSLLLKVPEALDFAFNISPHRCVWMRGDAFGYAERILSWPRPEGLTPRMYLGADGRRYIYLPEGESDDEPWTVNPLNDSGAGEGYMRHSAEAIGREHREALPLREFVMPEEESE